MSLDWREVCAQYGIEFIEKGSSVSKGNIAIHCPFCGPADHGHHMGLSLDTNKPFYGCWRNTAHRGRDPYRLLAALLGPERARNITRDSRSKHPEDAEPHSEKEIEAIEKHAIKMPLTFRRLAGTTNPYSAQQFIRYLQGRGFDRPEEMADLYDLHFCLTGDFRNRIIFPVYRLGKLVDYVGRTIKNGGLRYRAREDGDLKAFIGNHDEAENGADLLLITEGPYDFMKLDWYMPPLADMYVVCMFGTAVTVTQEMDLALLIRRKFNRAIILFDAGAEVSALNMMTELSDLTGKSIRSTTVQRMGFKAEDPGDMSMDQVRRLCDRFSKYNWEEKHAHP